MTHLQMRASEPVIVVADDDKDLLTLIRMKLQKEGFKVRLCYNGLDILAVAEREKADLILLDVTMDGINGKDLCKLLKSHKQTSAIPIILFSGNDSLDQVAISCGANGFIAKPFELETVKRKIREALACADGL